MSRIYFNRRGQVAGYSMSLPGLLAYGLLGLPITLMLWAVVLEFWLIWILIRLFVEFYFIVVRFISWLRARNAARQLQKPLRAPKNERLYYSDRR